MQTFMLRIFLSEALRITVLSKHINYRLELLLQ